MSISPGGAGGDRHRDTGGGTVTVSASASDSSGTVSLVELYVDGRLKAGDTASPWSFPCDTSAASNGSHTLTARAYELSGNVGTSAGVAVTVSNATTAQLIVAGGFEGSTTPRGAVGRM